jgi:hypothetical protein
MDRAKNVADLLFMKDKLAYESSHGRKFRKSRFSAARRRATHAQEVQDQRIHDLNLVGQTHVGKFADFLRLEIYKHYGKSVNGDCSAHTRTVGLRAFSSRAASAGAPVVGSVKSRISSSAWQSSTAQCAW